MHPFLDESFHVRWSTLVPEAVEPDIRRALALAKDSLDAIRAADLSALTYDNTFVALEKATEPLSRGWGLLNHLDSVNDGPEQRAALNAMLPEVSDFYASIPLDDALWTVLKTYGRSAAVAELDPIRRRYVEETMNDFVQSGADLPADKKSRIAEIEAELSKITQEYTEHVLDSTNAWELVIEDESKLAGLPDSSKAAALANAKARGVATEDKPAWRFTLQYPSMGPVMQYLHDDGIRQQVWEASTKVGATGDFDNTALVWKILELRHEKAAILGHDDFADLTLLRRMAKDGKTALRFTEDLHTRVKPGFLADYKQLKAYKAAANQAPADDFQPWETGYWAERQRKENYDLDDEALRPYFPVEGVMAGMFELSSRLFGITIRQREAVYYERGQRPEDAPADVIEVWHPEVTFYEIHDSETGRHLGSFYADWHPREPKRGGAWMNCLHTGGPDEPHLGLITGNMSPPVDGKPALLTHGEVETVFHEFGHLLHGLLSDVPVKSLSGTNVPWDFVELPSQIMENFCWDRQSLDLFARHHETGEPIPEELYAKMKAAQNYMSATAFIRQLAFGKLDLELHINLDRYRGRDLDEVDREILADYRTPLKTDTPSMTRRFNHLFSSPTGYAAGYYSYKWAEVLDADAFTRFQQEGVLNPETGRSFREHILSKGNSAPVDELYRRFMGRDPELEPLLVRAGIA
ncbi:M3 family metallopeptidase [Luteolibacter ambystomatis]|uniref:oligopeptidase A n=1 Tax=Luteolibacter ambystomatis TaxID=2824561 RepID=A0A975G796_9BACT|nr:M3 family metallopeptidase [Luteolibacter ambystomatis]QUE50629.1 M3 family metallopeptidase [Luteolibacter ambystomatis]